MDPTIAERATRITPQEWRVIALAIEGVAPSAVCEALGIALGTLESHKQAIRRKLGIPKGQRFEAFVRDHFAGELPTPEQAKPRAVKPSAPGERPQDRRVRWLLRITMQELQELAMSAGLRAASRADGQARRRGGRPERGRPRSRRPADALEEHAGAVPEDARRHPRPRRGYLPNQRVKTAGPDG